MNLRKSKIKWIGTFFMLCMLMVSVKMPVHAGVTDTDPNIIRTTTTNYYTTVKIEGTLSYSDTEYTRSFSQEGEKIIGNINDDAVQAEIIRLKDAFSVWAADNNGQNVSYPKEGIAVSYYEVHDEIVNSNDNVSGVVTINTVLDKYQVYTIEATAEYVGQLKWELVPNFPTKQNVVVGTGQFERPRFDLKCENGEVVENEEASCVYFLGDNTIDPAEYLSKQPVGATVEIGYMAYIMGFEPYVDVMTFTIVDSKVYAILDGKDAVWTIGQGGTLSFRGEGEFNKFVEVKIDGATVPASNYDAKSGSTIITLKEGYLDSLQAGGHTFEMDWTDGSASCDFTVKAKNVEPTEQDVKKDSPKTSATKNNSTKVAAAKTGDTRNTNVWIILAVSSLIVLTLSMRKMKDM